MNKAMFIVSARQFRNVIHELNPDGYDKYDDVFLKGEGNRVYFEHLPGKPLDVETKNTPFRLRMDAKQIRKLYRVLGIIEDQPITITADVFNSSLGFYAVV